MNQSIGELSLKKIHKSTKVPTEGMDFGRLQDAGRRFVGTFDFRNFCKMDLAQTTTFRRTILSFEVQGIGHRSCG